MNESLPSMKKPGSKIQGTGQIYYCPLLLLELVTPNDAVTVHRPEQFSARFTRGYPILSLHGHGYARDTTELCERFSPEGLLHFARCVREEYELIAIPGQMTADYLKTSPKDVDRP